MENVSHDADVSVVETDVIDSKIACMEERLGERNNNASTNESYVDRREGENRSSDWK